MQTLLSNPRALEAVMQIQQALQQLQNEAPGLFPGYNSLFFLFFLSLYFLLSLQSFFIIDSYLC